MAQAVASSVAMRDLISRMATATDDELEAIAKHVTASAWSVVDAITENPIAGLFDPKAPEIVQQQDNLRSAISAVTDATIKGRQSIIDALTYLQATVETTNAFYSDNEAWSGAVGQFGADLANLAQDIANKAIKPLAVAAVKGIWHRFRWYVIGLGIAAVVVAVFILRKE
jgi:hypothetical protein